MKWQPHEAFLKRRRITRIFRAVEKCGDSSPPGKNVRRRKDTERVRFLRRSNGLTDGSCGWRCGRSRGEEENDGCRREGARRGVEEGLKLKQELGGEFRAGVAALSRTSLETRTGLAGRLFQSRTSRHASITSDVSVAATEEVSSRFSGRSSPHTHPSLVSFIETVYR